MENKVQKCSICKREFVGHGNNAQPINNGRCCNECNVRYVIPIRLKELRSKLSNAV